MRPAHEPSVKPNPKQFETTWLFPHCKEVVRIDEVARALAMCDEQVRAHIQEGNFLAAPINDQADAQRKHLRILRFSVEAWWLNKLEDQGASPPFTPNPQVLWWRDELRRKWRVKFVEVCNR